MSAREDYLADVLITSPRSRLDHLFRLRRQRIKALSPTSEIDPDETAFIDPARVEAILRGVEARLFTAPIEENEAELIALVGKTEVHTRWWKRLHVANESRPVLERLASRSPQWAAILGRIQDIIATPQATRDEARSSFLAEVTPILARSDQPKTNLYPLLQTYGGRAVFEALMSRLLIDAPAFHALESIFFAHFNADAGSGLVGLRGSGNAPRSRNCPIQPEPLAPGGTLKARLATLGVYLGMIGFWVWILYSAS